MSRLRCRICCTKQSFRPIISLQVSLRQTCVVITTKLPRMHRLQVRQLLATSTRIMVKSSSTPRTQTRSTRQRSFTWVRATTSPSSKACSNSATGGSTARKSPLRPIATSSGPHGKSRSTLTSFQTCEPPAQITPFKHLRAPSPKLPLIQPRATIHPPQ